MSRPDGYLVPDVPAVDEILAEVARGFRVTVDDILSRDRSKNVHAARVCAMAVIRETTDWSLPQIGRYFGGRDHTTVMHHVAKVMADPELSQSVALVVDVLRPPPRLFAVPDDPRQEAV